ncbi:MAG: hypothetical protein PHX82_14820, partial [Paracoccaceae bacterium]|nr:hypothetical protein [Paracoccaceae bacterium]
VSYGTFSCTLEGFDEPFNTMKAIAEYFRDLAADDRYFGAEPPTPDAEMLHRIAEREIHRRVEAKINANGVVLRPQLDAASEPMAAPAPDLQAAPPQPEPRVATAPLAETAVEPAAQDTPATAPAQDQPVNEAPQIISPASSANPVPDSVAAKLQRIRAAVASARAAASVTPSYAEDEEAILDVAPDALSNPALDMEFIDQSVAEAEDFGFSLDVSGPLSAEDLDEDTAPETAPILEAADLVPEPEDEVEPEAVIAPIAETEPVAEPEPVAQAELEISAAAEPVPEVAPPAVEAEVDRHAELSARRAARRAARAAALSAAAQELAQPEAPAPVEGDLAVQEQDGAEAAQEAQQDTDDEPLLASVKAALAQQDIAPEETFEDQATAEDTPPEAMVRDAALSDTMPEAADAEVLPEPVAPTRPQIRARVIKVRRAEPIFPAAPEPAMAQEAPQKSVADLDATDIAEALAARLAAEAAPAPVTDPKTALSPEEEAELQAELAALEADIPAPQERDVAQAEAAPEETTASQPDADPEADLSRLMRQADEQLSGQENRRRFSAIAHLKAAVAATVADRRILGGAKPADDTKAYRDDLSQAVRPRRPSAPQAHTQRPEVAPVRAAPLVLVSEQRVDRPEGEALNSGAVVRPRRISTAQIARDMAEDETDIPAPIPAGEAASFADFAESLGTQGLSDLLEAAAAYTAQIEGRPHFSPPQIMKKVAAMSEGADVTREERLRVFGKLLRQGKIAKVRRGQYAITEQSRFYAEAKRA